MFGPRSPRSALGPDVTEQDTLASKLGIEHPRLRNGRAIANLNSLIYVLLNLRAFQRVRNQTAQPASA